MHRDFFLNKCFASGQSSGHLFVCLTGFPFIVTLGGLKTVLPEGSKCCLSMQRQNFESPLGKAFLLRSNKLHALEKPFRILNLPLPSILSQGKHLEIPFGITCVVHLRSVFPRFTWTHPWTIKFNTSPQHAHTFCIISLS